LAGGFLLASLVGMTRCRLVKELPAFAGMTRSRLVKELPAFAGMTRSRLVKELPAFAGMTRCRLVKELPAFAGMTCHKEKTQERRGAVIPTKVGTRLQAAPLFGL